MKVDSISLPLAFTDLTMALAMCKAIQSIRASITMRPSSGTVP